MSLHLRGTCPQESCRSGALRACIDAKGESVQRGVWRCVSYGGRVVRLLQDPLQVNACVFEVMDTKRREGGLTARSEAFHSPRTNGFSAVGPNSVMRRATYLATQSLTSS